MAVKTLNLAAGFHSDLSKLLEQFSEGPEISMNGFTILWRKMEFLKVFLYREGKELTMFTEECFRILLRMILTNPSIQQRIGAFFCLYSMYIMQPSKPKVKIRMVPEAWKSFQNLIEESQLEPWENEVKFAFWTLAYQNAFFFVAKQSSIGLLNTASEGDAISTANFDQIMGDYMSADHQCLQEVHDRYMGLKGMLPASTAKTVQMAEKDLLNSVVRNVEELKNKFEMKSYRPVQEEDSGSDLDLSEESDADEDDTLERRRNVRSKQQVLHVQQSKSRRHRETEAPETSKGAVKTRGRPRGSRTGARKRKATFNESDRPFQDLIIAESE